MTELDAFAALNSATHVLWWNKPLNVSRPVLVYQDEKKLATDKGEEQGDIGIDERAGLGQIQNGEEGHLRKERGCGKACIRGLVDIPKEVYRENASML